MNKILLIGLPSIISILSASWSFAFDVSSLEFYKSYPYVTGDGHSSEYRKNKWSIIVPSNKKTYFSTIVSDYNFRSPANVPLGLGVSCINGRYFINVKTNKDDLNERFNFYLPEKGMQLSFFAGFDDESLKPLV